MPGIGERNKLYRYGAGNLARWDRGRLFHLCHRRFGQWSNGAANELNFAYASYGLQQSRDFYSQSVFGHSTSGGTELDESNNTMRADLPVTYREPDLVVSALTVPTQPRTPGDTISVNWTVTNSGSRATREASWTDNIFLSRTARLAPTTTSSARSSTLAHWGGQFYNGQASLKLPNNIDGDFYILLRRTPSSASSTGRPARPRRRPHHRQRQRVPGRGQQLKERSDHTACTNAADLVVTQVTAPAHVTVGQPISVSFTVANVGGSTLPEEGSWTDAVYLSRDPISTS